MRGHFGKRLGGFFIHKSAYALWRNVDEGLGIKLELTQICTSGDCQSLGFNLNSEMEGREDR